MNWFNHLENLRSKSEESRRRIAFWSSTGITAFVALIWLASLSFTLSSPVSKTAQVANVKSSDEDNVASVGMLNNDAASSTGGNFISDQKENIIEGWRVITNQAKN